MPNQLGAFNPEVWSKLVIQKLYRENVAMFVAANTDYEGDVKQSGSTVYVRTYQRVSWLPYTKGEPLVEQPLGSIKETMVVNDAHSFNFAIDDLDEAQSDLPLEEPYAREAAISANELIDDKILSYFSSANAANVIGTSGAPITLSDTGSTSFYAQTVAANLALDIQNVSQSGRWMIVGPQVKSWIAKDTTLIKSMTPLAGTILMTGRPGATLDAAPNYLGNLNGFDIYWSNALKKPASGVTANLFGQGKPISYAAKFQRLETIRSPNTFATLFRGLLLHDGKVFTEHSKRLGVLYTN